MVTLPDCFMEHVIVELRIVKNSNATMKHHIESPAKNKKEAEKTEEIAVLPKTDQLESMPIMALQKLKKDIEHLKTYQEYRKQKVNFETLDNLENEIDKLSFGKEKLDNVPMAKNILHAHIENVKRGTNDYYQKIEGLGPLAEMQKERLDETDFQDWLHKQDKHRGQIHDVLIESLKILTRFCVNQNENLKVKTLFSLTGVAFPQDKLFSAAELNDRNFVGDWAFRAEKGRRIKEIHDQIEKQILNTQEKKPE